MRIAARLSLLGLALLAACGGGGSGTDYTTSPPGNTGNPGNSGTPVATNAVTVVNNAFSPAAIQVSPGTTVNWTWSSEATDHNVRFADGTGSETLRANATYSRTFNTAGTFAYQCTLHPGMTGTVTVR